MSFSRASALGWALYEPLTSAQMNALDIDHANAIDKVDGDTVEPATDDINVQHTYGFGLRWLDPYWPLLEAREVQLWQPLSPIVFMSEFNTSYEPWYYAQGTKDWETGEAAGRRGAIVQSYTHAANVATLSIECLKIPLGAMVKGIGVKLYQPNASGGAIGSPPKLDITQMSYTADGAPAAVGATATASATYNQVMTDLEVTFTPANYDGARLIATVRGEAGANAQTDMRILGLYVRMNVSTLRY